MFYFSLDRIFSINVTPLTGFFTTLGLIFGPIFNYFYGDGRSHFITVLFLLVVIDWISGIVASKKDSTYSSAYGIEGIARTIVILMLPALANLLDYTLDSKGILFYGITFGLYYHIFQSFIANSVRAKWDKWIPNYLIEKAASEIKAKLVRAQERKNIIDSVDNDTKTS